jgi:hypothetical protein
MAIEREWDIDLKADDAIFEYEQFYFFQSRVIDKRFNHVTSGNEGVKWEICDLIFQEGALLAAETYKTTVGLIRFPHTIPKFTIEKKEFLDRYQLPHKDIDYEIYEDFSKEYIVKVESIEEMKAFLSPEMTELIENSGRSHMESDGQGILIFSNGLKLAQIGEFADMVKFLEDLRIMLSKEGEIEVSKEEK